MAEYICVEDLQDELKNLDFFPALVKAAIRRTKRVDMRPNIHAHIVGKTRHRNSVEYIPVQCPNCANIFSQQIRHDYELEYGYCSNCGFIVDNANAKFCQNCGAIFDEQEEHDNADSL